MNQITIFGIGCEDTLELEAKVYKAVLMLDLDVLIGREEDINSFLKLNLTKIPAVMINNEVILQGDVLNENEMLELLKNTCTIKH